MREVERLLRVVFRGDWAGVVDPDWGESCGESSELMSMAAEAEADGGVKGASRATRLEVLDKCFVI